MAGQANPPRENLIRAIYPESVELREAGADKMPTLAGYAAVNDTWTEIASTFEGRFMERIAPGAFSRTINGRMDKVKVLFNHGSDPMIGDKPLGPLSVLEEDSHGLRYEAPLLDTSYNRDLLPGLRAGLYGASFRFSVIQDSIVNKPSRSEHNPNGLPERTLHEVKLMELGPVTFPAYDAATAGVRSLTDEIWFSRFAEDPERLAELIAAYKARTEGLVSVTLASSPSATNSSGSVTLTQYPDSGRSVATTPLSDPEPSEATTHSTRRGHFWFAATPKHLKEK